MVHRPPEPGQVADAPALSPVESTLLIPLADRAHSEHLFPHLAVHDTHDAATLARLHVDVSPFLQDPLSIHGELSRTRLVEGMAFDFLSATPKAEGQAGLRTV